VLVELWKYVEVVVVLVTFDTVVVVAVELCALVAVEPVATPPGPGELVVEVFVPSIMPGPVTDDEVTPSGRAVKTRAEGAATTTNTIKTTEARVERALLVERACPNPPGLISAKRRLAVEPITNFGFGVFGI